MIGAWRLPSTWASGTVFAACPSFGIHWMAPAGLRVCSHSKANRFVRYIIVHCVGAAVQAPSRPLVTVSSALPLPHLLRPAEALLLDGGGRRLRTHAIGRLVRAMDLAEGVAAGDQGDGLFVVHGHAAEALADLLRGGERVRVAAGAFRVHVDEAHLRRGEGRSPASPSRRSARRPSISLSGPQ